MNILIYGVFPDIHTEAVAWGLREKGITVDIWNQANFPVQQNMSVNLDCATNSVDWNIHDFSVDVRTIKYDLVWFRRNSDPTLSESLNKADQDMAHRESLSMMLGMDHVLGGASRWIDHPLTTRRASLKIYQLQLAMESGLQFPPTLFSNDPKEVRAFAAVHESIIYKPFYQMSWKAGKSVRNLYTSKVKLEQLSNDAALSACPGIFQKCIEKQYEIRLTMLGDDHIALKIYDYPSERAAVDWRSASFNGVKYDVIDLPDWLIERSRKLMQKLNLRFGCLDFIVDVDNNYHFLEVNPSGQFLWTEDARPEVPMLDRFCDFLIREVGGTPPAGIKVTLKQFEERAASGEEGVAGPDHVAYSNPFMYSEA